MDSISAPPMPLQTIIPMYAYEQYADDPDIVAFFDAINAIGQTYLDWFNAVPFGVYVSPNITGQLLDWLAMGIYGIPRPIFSTISTQYVGAALNAIPLNMYPLNGSKFFQSGSAELATDDFYKRTITWLTYLGDGRLCNAMTIRKRIARFLYGVNGGDVTVGQTQSVSVAVVTSPSVKYAITVPASANPASSYFKEAFEAGILTFPFQLDAEITIV